ncbi:hypothetical protein ACSDR0_23970 [Streptosporangium sp. G11]|uniref:hypothetical protein n=1 Tax=Streptosporangium sp. G11 TaxID=3436926 RepID=UPI003EB6A2DF
MLLLLARLHRVVIVALGMIPLLMIILSVAIVCPVLACTADGRTFILALAEKVIKALKIAVGGAEQ